MAQGGSVTPAQVRPGPCHQPGPGILRSRDPGGNTMRPVCVSPCHCRGRGWSLQHSHYPVTLRTWHRLAWQSSHPASPSSRPHTRLVTWRPLASHVSGPGCVTRLAGVSPVCVSATQSQSGNWLSVGECQVLTPGQAASGRAGPASAHLLTPGDGWPGLAAPAPATANYNN